MSKSELPKVPDELKPSEDPGDVSLFPKDVYDTVLDPDDVELGFERDCNTVFACRHKFCREPCPVFQETGNESHTSYGFHTAILALAEGEADFSELGEQFSHCLQCGACETKCPNTLFAGDFYRHNTTTVDLVRKIRHDIVTHGESYPGLENVQQEVKEHLDHAQDHERLTQWADDLDLKKDEGETIFFVDCFAALEMTEAARSSARVMKEAGVDFGILSHPLCVSLESYEAGFDEMHKQFALKNIETIQATGAERIVVCDPHTLVGFERDYRRMFGELPFEVMFITDLVYELIEDGKIEFTEELDLDVDYHDPCSLNKLGDVWDSPRDILDAIPGVTVNAPDRVEQWDMCCGYGTSNFKAMHPEKSQQIGEKRLAKAQESQADALVAGCTHCKDQFMDVGLSTGLEMDTPYIMELVIEAMGGH